MVLAAILNHLVNISEVLKHAGAYKALHDVSVWELDPTHGVVRHRVLTRVHTCVCALLLWNSDRKEGQKNPVVTEDPS